MQNPGKNKNKGKGQATVPAQVASESIQYKRWLWTRVFRILANIARPTIFTTGATIGIYFLSKAIEAYAGRQSSANMNFFFGIFSQFSFVVTITGASNALWLFLYKRERRVRMELTKKFGSRIATLEQTIDSRRRSSNLELDGTTRKEDL